MTNLRPLRSWGMGRLMNAILRFRVPFALLVALGLVSGCNEDKKPATTEEDAGTAMGPQKPMLGGKLGAAVAAAESARTAPPSASSDGPPENGVFAPGLADKAHAKGVPPKLELLGQGTEPRVLLAPGPSADEQKEVVAVVLHLSGQALNLEYALSVKPEKAKDEGKSDAGSSAGTTVIATIARAQTSSPVPKEVIEQIAKLKGGQIRLQFAPNGGLLDSGYTLSKDADAGLEVAMKGLFDALVSTAVPMPSKPVGVGAYWMVSERAPSFLGVDVVRYRVVKVEKVEKDKATLAVEIRQYATQNSVELGGGGKVQTLGMDGFDSAGKAKVEWAATRWLSPKCELSTRLQIAARIPGAPQGQRGGVVPIQTELSANLEGVEGAAKDKKK